MKAFSLAAAAILAGSAAGPAGELPVIFEKPFLGCFLGFTEAREFQFALGGDGSSELFFMKDRDQRLSSGGLTVKFDYVLEEQEKGKKRWTNRTMQEDGFETSQKATVTPELDKPITFTATYTGGTKVEITHLFTKETVEIRTRILEKTTANPVRAGVRILVGDMYRHIKEELDERELKSKIKDSRIQVWPVGSRRSSGERIDLHEIDVKLQEKFPEGATKFQLESDRLADHEYTITTADERYGRLEFRQTRDLYHGFSVYWWPDPAKAAEKDCRMIFEVD